MRWVMMITLSSIICLSCSRTATKQAVPKPQAEFEFSKDYYEWPVINSADTTHELSYGFWNDDKPNPFSWTPGKFRYALPQPCDVNVDIYNVQKTKLGTLELGFKQPGFYIFEWYATNAPPGVYFITFRACDYSKETKFILMK